MNYSNKNEILNNFIQQFIEKNRSIISDIFFGITQICSSCSVCKSSKYEFESFHSLYFDLWEIKSFKIDNYSNLNNLNIKDCFDYYKKLEYIIGNCQNCRNNNRYPQIKSIYSAPKLLIIILNISKEIPNKIKFDLWDCLDLTNYVEVKINKCIYNLRGIVACNINNGQ